MARSTGDSSKTIMDLIRESTKTQRFAHKNDLWAVLQNRMGNTDFEGGLKTLLDDGEIYTSVGNDCFSITD